jgi:hypothetical protein
MGLIYNVVTSTVFTSINNFLKFALIKKMITGGKAAAAAATTKTTIIQVLFTYVMTQQPIIRPFKMVSNV